MGNDPDDYTRRLRKSVQNRVDSGDVSWQEFWEEVHEKVLNPEGKTPEYQIRDIIMSFDFSSSPIGKERKEEEWLTSQLFGGLQAELHDDFSVYMEYEVDPYRKHRVDIFIEKAVTGSDSVFETSGNYLIELKRAKNMGSVNQLVSQVRSYHLSDAISDRKRTFVVLFSDIDLDKVKHSDAYDLGTIPSEIVNPADMDILDTGETVPSAQDIQTEIDDIDNTEAIFFGFHW